MSGLLGFNMTQFKNPLILIILAFIFTRLLLKSLKDSRRMFSCSDTLFEGNIYRHRGALRGAPQQGCKQKVKPTLVGKV